MKLYLLVAFLASSLLNVNADIYCYGQDAERTQTRHFTSKTAYQIIKGTGMDKVVTVPNCKATKVWLFHRHGTRLPGKSTIELFPRLEELQALIMENAQIKRTTPELCLEDTMALKFWQRNTSITVDMENYLTFQGYEDLKGTAKTYQRLFPDVLTKDYNENYYLFRHTDTQRTTESFKAFAEGLFGTGNEAVPQPIPEQDLLLRPYDYCTPWQEQNYKGAGSQSDYFRKSSLWNSTLWSVSKRLGFDYVLAEDDVMLMYDMCRYDQAWQVDRASAWCAAFLPEHVSVFEFEDDMKYFYKSGYGFEENTQLNCRAVQDMIAHLNSSSLPGAVAYFGHSTGVQTLLSALGINKDANMLNSTNYATMTDRKWQTSTMDPFAGNFLAVKYECDDDTEDKNKVMFFLNQYPVDLDWCKVGLCNWSDVLQRYDTIIKANCDDYYCRSSASILSISSLLSLLLAAIIYLMN